jgi:hypothetical protein
MSQLFETSNDPNEQRDLSRAQAGLLGLAVEAPPEAAGCGTGGGPGMRGRRSRGQRARRARVQPEKAKGAAGRADRMRASQV